MRCRLPTGCCQRPLRKGSVYFLAYCGSFANVALYEADFDVEDLLDIHRVLLEMEGTSESRFAGVVRTDQNWIGGRGASPADARFVPPPPERVPGLLDDLVRFVNRDDLPSVAQAAVAHAQFETIAIELFRSPSPTGRRASR